MPHLEQGPASPAARLMRPSHHLDQPHPLPAGHPLIIEPQFQKQVPLTVRDLYYIILQFGTREPLTNLLWWKRKEVKRPELRTCSIHFNSSSYWISSGPVKSFASISARLRNSQPWRERISARHFAIPPETDIGRRHPLASCVRTANDFARPF